MSLSRKENRKHPRSYRGFPVLPADTGADTGAALVDYIDNLSAGGAMCNAVAPVPVMSKIKLAFELPGSAAGRLECDGIVIRQMEEGHKTKVALVFTNLPESVRLAIEEFIAQHPG